MDARLLGVLIDQLAVAPQALQLPIPVERRARAITDLLLESPDEQSGIDALGRHVGTSRRTLERMFRAHTNMTPGAWRRQLRLQHAVKLLEGGMRVGVAARQAGYASPSAFIAVFKKNFGTTPRRYTIHHEGTKTRRSLP